MNRVSLPKLTGDERLNAEVIVEVRFPRIADIDTGRHVHEQRYALRGWDRLVPDAGDITSAAYGVPPGTRYVVLATISSMSGKCKQIYRADGRVSNPSPRSVQQISHELSAWLGPAADDLTDDQLTRIVHEERRITERYPDPDDRHLWDAAMSATVQYLLGDTAPEDAARALTTARAEATRAFAASVQIATMLAADNPRYKATAATRTGIDRMSLLKALGER